MQVYASKLQRAARSEGIEEIRISKMSKKPHCPAYVDWPIFKIEEAPHLLHIWLADGDDQSPIRNIT